MTDEPTMPAVAGPLDVPVGPDAWAALYFHAHRLIEGIGYHGEISSKCDAVEQLEQALAALDGGEYKHGLSPGPAKARAVVRSVASLGDDGVRIKWLGGFPQIGDKLY